MKFTRITVFSNIKSIGHLCSIKNIAHIFNVKKYHSKNYENDHPQICRLYIIRKPLVMHEQHHPDRLKLLTSQHKYI